ncbi:type I methionyl aminopeptidase [Microtetraspora sp. NBRC 16547]|uniref:type I methionyl aminopeptidase n=1 Tax=Microtetraspora sp. NBRC 16547 TaxID=3030993 RepID=UPI0024A485BD|nr:type I methionyl aminopeptidase [Microtetraspora sp. NBRC 16547]GLX01677.1 methionine aminopeptidase [Microtetraspora sp. NBRC 16547]
MVEIKTEGELTVMREAGRVVARALAAARELAVPGAALKDLNEAAATVIHESGATSAFLNYKPHFAPTPFPAMICTSVNDSVVHGIPDGYRLREGDLLSVDCGAYLDGWAGDAAISVVVGRSDPTASAADLALIQTAQAALDAAIAAAVPGARLGDIGHAVSTVGRAAGYGILSDFGGHGVGRHMHEDPHVPNEARPGRGMVLRPGMVLAIEPMFISGGRDQYRVAPDGWTLRSVDRSRAAHVEHTMAVAEDGPRVLTLP